MNWFPIVTPYKPRFLMLGKFPAPITYRICGASYVHRWWRLERSFRVVELDVEFGSEAYHAAIREHDIGCVFLAVAPVSRAAFFTAIAAYQRYPNRLWRHPGVNRAHADNVRINAHPRLGTSGGGSNFSNRLSRNSSVDVVAMSST